MPTAAASKEYAYDAQGQLATETDGSVSRAYAYDTVGNIRSVTTDGAVIKSFGYTNPSWPDLLTSVTSGSTTKDILYEGQSQTSDLPSSGNPVTYYNGRDYTFTWTKGRQLASATVDGKQISYTYDMSGVRSNKQVGDTTYTYTTLSGKVMRQQWGEKSLEFVYDDGNQPFAVIYKHGQTTELYYYVLNAQGDVSAILDSSGKLAASYDYDAWGNCTVYDSSAKVLTDPTSIANLNPLRYRGYYYDAETGFYYLQSRYYDPAICRFINADGLFTDGFIGANLFAYCANNPVNTVDPTGNFAITATVALITFGVALVATALAVGISSSPGFQGALDDACKTAVSAVNTAVSAGRSAVSAVSDALTKQKAKRNNTVYRLVDADGQVQYVGRTTNVEARKAAHQRNPNRSSLKFEIIAPGLSYYEARGLEQIAMIEYHTINAKNRMNNQINGISPSNKLLVIYMEAGRGVAAYLENQISNEALYWAGR